MTKYKYVSEDVTFYRDEEAGKNVWKTKDGTRTASKSELKRAGRKYNKDWWDKAWDKEKDNVHGAVQRQGQRWLNKVSKNYKFTPEIRKAILAGEIPSHDANGKEISKEDLKLYAKAVK